MKTVFLRSFLKDIKKLNDPATARKLEKALANIKMADSPGEVPDLKKMKGYSFVYRVKVGEYRLGIYMEGDAVEVARFVKRNDIYKVFPKKGAK